MITFERTNAKNHATTVKLIEASPELLRQLADRLDIGAKNALKGETVVCPLTDTITLIYQPDKSFPEGASIELKSALLAPESTETV
jgi:NADH dehydrogenase FAD-containing subunit